MSRYPYTIADDFIRGIAGYGENGTKLSRSDASQILHAVADAIGMDHEELFKKVADTAMKYEADGGHPIVVMNLGHFVERLAK